MFHGPVVPITRAQFRYYMSLLKVSFTRREVETRRGWKAAMFRGTRTWVGEIGPVQCALTVWVQS
jgi:hypothetical protein